MLIAGGELPPGPDRLNYGPAGKEHAIMGRRRKQKLVLGKDYFYQNGHCVLTRSYLLSQGECCNNNCPQCPYKPVPSSASSGTTPAMAAVTSRRAR